MADRLSKKDGIYKLINNDGIFECVSFWSENSPFGNLDYYSKRNPMATAYNRKLDIKQLEEIIKNSKE